MWCGRALARRLSEPRVRELGPGDSLAPRMCGLIVYRAISWHRMTDSSYSGTTIANLQFHGIGRMIHEKRKWVRYIYEAQFRFRKGKLHARFQPAGKENSGSLRLILSKYDRNAHYDEGRLVSSPSKSSTLSILSFQKWNVARIDGNQRKLTEIIYHKKNIKYSMHTIEILYFNLLILDIF